MPRRSTVLNRDRVAFVLLMVAGGIGLYGGWRLFWFLTDDAYIAFRYASNSLFGHGYVWNAPPFAPVEGYTSFLWVALLDAIWRFTGVDPPRSANVVALAFSFATLVLSAALVMRLAWTSALRRWRLAQVALLVAFLVLNRTFLTWASSGLETAMFDFFLITWVFVLLVPWPRPRPRRVALGSAVAVALALSRPDGLLFCAAMLAITWLESTHETTGKGARGILVRGWSPLLLVAVHEAWRVSFYGEWLPNTYYAKIAGAWPASGVRYALAFAMEYGLWFAGAIVGWALLRARTRTSAAGPVGGRGPSGTDQPSSPVPGRVRLLVCGTLTLHLAYYTLVVGGDHFEYRVYGHLIPLSFVLVLWALNRLVLRPLPALALASGCLLLSLPVPWTHWQLTRKLETRRETHVMTVPIAPHWPAPLRWYAEWFDDLQSWLIEHHVGMRHQEHKVFWQTQIRTHPTREQGLAISPASFPVFATSAVGVSAWTLPHVNIIDTFGLNDLIIARTPVPPGSARLMAHSRQPPAGYVESYRPNVLLGDGLLRVVDRQPPLTATDIERLEAAWRHRLPAIRQGQTTAAATRP